MSTCMATARQGDLHPQTAKHSTGFLPGSGPPRLLAYSRGRARSIWLSPMFEEVRAVRLTRPGPVPTRPRPRYRA